MKFDDFEFDEFKFAVRFASEFKKSFRKLNVKEQNLTLEAVGRLANDERLEARFKDHALKGEFAGLRECHVKPDLLLVYEKRDDVLVLVCVSVGSHSELFG